MKKKVLNFLLFIIVAIIIKIFMDAVLINLFNKTLSEIVRDFITNLL